jgi:pimeloyl-ACP methyl ester carboxylesterase
MAAGDLERAAMHVKYRTQIVGHSEIFYREAGPANAPVILLLHGFPTSSHMFRDLIPELSHRYRVIAPDLPGFGQTRSPPRGSFDYTFDNLTRVMQHFVDQIGIDRFALYAFDYGAPIGYRMASARPERIRAIVSQNGNAYLEGLSDAWESWQAYWRTPTAANRENCRASLLPETIRDWLYLLGADARPVSPDGYTLDLAYLARPGAEDIQLDLILDYRSNLDRYPEFQTYFRTWQPPLLAVWGKNDPALLPAGAEAYRRDLPNASVHLLDTGHFAIETHAPEIAAFMLRFLDENGIG